MCRSEATPTQKAKTMTAKTDATETLAARAARCSDHDLAVFIDSAEEWIDIFAEDGDDAEVAAHYDWLDALEAEQAARKRYSAVRVTDAASDVADAYRALVDQHKAGTRLSVVLCVPTADVAAVAAAAARDFAGVRTHCLTGANVARLSNADSNTIKAAFNSRDASERRLLVIDEAAMDDRTVSYCLARALVLRFA